MKGKELYPNIVYFELAKEMPLCEIGSRVSICDADGRECLSINGIEMPIDLAIKAPDWFVAVDEEKHQKICYENSIEYFISKRRSREDAKRIVESEFW